MSKIELDMLYGVRSFEGIPVRFTKLACKTVYKVKRWKRLNRPDKIKTKAVYTPTAYQVGGVLYLHPTLKPKFMELS